MDLAGIVTYKEDTGKSWSEVADELGMNENTLRSRVSRYKKGELASQKQGEDFVVPEFPDHRWPEDVSWREFLVTWDQVLEQHKRFDPIIQHLTIDLSEEKKPIVIVSASDLHLGGGFTDHRALLRTMEYIIETPRVYLGITGDSIEGFIPGEKSAETVEQMAGSTKAQIAALRSLVNELGPKLLWMGWGDHDAKWFEKLIGRNTIKHEIHDRVPYFTGRGIIRLKLSNQEYFLQVNHAEMFRSQWNPNHPNRRAFERYFPADVNISGHLHKPAFQMFYHYELVRNAGINLGGKTWLVQNGTFKTGPDPYTIRGWEPGIIGCPSLVLNPNEHDVDVLDSPDKAVKLARAL